MRFSPRAGDATIFKKIASPSQAKNRSCSRGFKVNDRVELLPINFLNLWNKTKQQIYINDWELKLFAE